MNKIIEVNNLTKDYGSNRGVFDISFHVNKGEVFGFLGPNGAGKSTTVRHLMGFSKPDSGNSSINNLDSFIHYNVTLKNVGYIPGELALPEGLSGYEFIKMIQDLKNITNNDLLENLLKIFQLDHNTLKDNTKIMSLGTKRKLAIITAFMSDPDILILDEPTSGLDPFLQDAFIEYIKLEKTRGKTILLSSHMFKEVEQTCDHISIIKDGKIVSSFKTSDFKHRKDKVYLVTFNKKLDFNEFKLLKSNLFELIEINDSKLNVLLSINDHNINNLITLLTQFNISDFRHQALSLEEYFLSFYLEDKDFGGIHNE